MIKNLKYLASGLVTCWLLLGSATATAGSIDIGAVLDNGTAVQQGLTSGDIVGTKTNLSAATFNAMSVSDLYNNFDVLLIGCCNSTNINVDWTTRLLPYLQLGGGVVFEAPYNHHLAQLAPVITANLASVGGTGWTYDAVPGLTDNMTGNVVNGHMNISAYDSSLFTPFMYNFGNVQGLYGEIGTNGGRFVLTSPDNCLHGQNTSGAQQQNYQLCVNTLNWAGNGTSVPAPQGGFLLLLALFGMLGFNSQRSA